MDWLFERMIELAAWAAFILGLIFLCESVYSLYQWGIWAAGIVDPVDGSQALLRASANAAFKFIGAALAMGTLAVIDRYVFDLPEEN